MGWEKIQSTYVCKCSFESSCTHKARFMLERAVCETAIVRDTPMFHVCIF